MRKLQHFSLLFFLSFCFVALNAQAEEYGMASYYGDEFHGGATASGEAYDKNKLTAAHKTLPMGTKVRVTRLDNKKSVVVRINDRGPYLKGRIIDLSGRAATTLDMIADGTTEVKIEVLGKGGAKKATSTIAKKPVIPEQQIPQKKVSTPASSKAKEATVAVKAKAKTKAAAAPAPKKRPKATALEPDVLTAKGATKANETPEFDLVTAKDYKEYDLYKIQVMRPKKKGYGVQVGSFSDYSNVMKKVAELQGQWFKNILISVEKGSAGQKIYKLILGPFPDQKTASSYKKHAKKNKKINGFVVSLEDIQAMK
jgi:rare lipoprotein A